MLIAGTEAAQKRLEKQLLSWNLQLTDAQYDQLRLYMENLLRWNNVMNLTTITEVGDIYEKHFLDSLAAVTMGRLPQLGRSWADIGTGAGFPGLPLAIACPEIEVTLIDSLRKRVKFLEDTVEQLGLKNVRVMHGRAEDLARQRRYREQFDVVCSRAVANMSTLSEYTLPYVKVGGSLLAYKSGNFQDELRDAEKAMQILGGAPQEVLEYRLPLTDYQRALIRIRKSAHTPSKYPRRAGIPSKEPLGINQNIK